MAKGRYEYWRTADGILLLKAWARRGLTLEEVAKQIGISRKTLHEWINRFGDIRDALKGRARECACAEIENAMHEHAKGHIAKVKKAFKLRHIDYDENGRKKREYETVELHEEEIYIPPDTTAGIYYLNNRCPERWSNKQEVNLDAKGGDFTLEIIGDGADAEGLSEKLPIGFRETGEGMTEGHEA